MRGQRFTRSQIVAILEEAHKLGDMAAVCQSHEISRKTLYRWQRRYGGMGAEEARHRHEQEARGDPAWIRRILAQRYINKHVRERRNRR